VAASTENAAKAIASNIDTLKKTFIQIADSYNRATGNTTLDATGARKYGHYDFWIVKENAPPNSNSFHRKVAPSKSIEGLSV
jgi:ABC-type branched-subunit amino acid transport system substrate-binding protein